MGRIKDKLKEDTEITILKKSLKPKKEETILLEDIKPHPDSVRNVHQREKIKGLWESIKSFGILTPLQIDMKGLIIQGNMRREALKFSDKKELKVIDIENDVDVLRYNKEVDIKVMQLLVDLHHTPLTLFERAEAFEKILKEKKDGIDTKYKLARYLKKSDQLVCRTMAILEASKETKERMKKGEITQRMVAMVMYRLQNKEREKEVIDYLIQNKIRNLDVAGNFIAEVNDFNTAKDHLINYIKKFESYIKNFMKKKKFIELDEIQKNEIKNAIGDLETTKKEFIKVIIDKK